MEGDGVGLVRTSFFSTAVDFLKNKTFLDLFPRGHKQYSRVEMEQQIVHVTFTRSRRKWRHMTEGQPTDEC